MLQRLLSPSERENGHLPAGAGRPIEIAFDVCALTRHGRRVPSPPPPRPAQQTADGRQPAL